MVAPVPPIQFGPECRGNQGLWHKLGGGMTARSCNWLMTLVLVSALYVKAKSLLGGLSNQGYKHLLVVQHPFVEGPTIKTRFISHGHFR